MTIPLLDKPPFLAEAEIERRANRLLRDAAEAGVKPAGHVSPIDDIAERVLGLSIELGDIDREFGGATGLGTGETLGAIDLDERAIWISERIDPSKGSRERHRYGFTLGHEIGHWELHRGLNFRPDQGELLLVGSDNTANVAVCRGLDEPVQHPPVEWQANTFAAHLLMPRKKLAAAWVQEHGADRPRILAADRYEPEIATGLEREMARAGKTGRPLSLFDAFCRLQALPFHTAFGVSRQAMAVQLKSLGLVLEYPAEQGDLFAQ